MSLEQKTFFWKKKNPEEQQLSDPHLFAPESQEQTVQDIESHFVDLLDNGKDRKTTWKEIETYLASLPQEIFKTSDCAQKLNDCLYLWLEKSEALQDRDAGRELMDVVYAQIQTLIMEKLVENPKSLPYLEDLLLNRPLPEYLKSSYGTANDFDDYEGPPLFNFYISAAGCIESSKLGQEAAPLLERLLAKCPGLIDHYFYNKNIEEGGYIPFAAFMGETEDEQFSLNIEGVSAALSREHGDIVLPRSIINALATSGRPESIPVIAEYIASLGPECAVLVEEVVTTSKAIDSRSAIVIWLKFARSDDPITRRFALSVLYRLEDRSIDIDTSGLSYLQKRYDLGSTYNNPDFNGQRITSQGHVGIFEKSSGELKKFFEAKGLDSDDVDIRAQVLDITYETLFTPLPGETTEERTERERLLKNFQEHYAEFFDIDFFQTTRLRFNDLNFQEQTAFISLYEHSSPEEKNDLSVFGLQHGLAGLRTLLVMNADADPHFGHAIVAAGISLPPRTAEQIFKTCNYLISIALQSAERALDEIRTDYPDTSLTADHVKAALFARGRDYLLSIISEIQSAPESADNIVNRYALELSQMTTSDHIFKSTFTAIAELLERKNINLANLAAEQSAVAQSFAKPRNKSIALQTLRQAGKLEPIPEIHWRVDRGPKEYNRRLGFDVTGFLTERKRNWTGSGQPILLEIGPGNGEHKKQREKMIAGYDDYSLSDKLYYPLTPVIEHMLDIPGVEKAAQITLSENDRHELADIIYKTLLIADGKTNADRIEYDADILASLRRDINTLRTMAPLLKKKLRQSSMVPNTISSRDTNGAVIYPYKQEFSQASTALQAALTCIKEEKAALFANIAQTTDCHEYIDAFAPNTILGDINDISRLADNQIDVELAVRSTVYSRGENYVRFLKDLSAKLRDGGVAIDDSIRDNDGWYYRFAEVAEALDQIEEKLEVMVVLGPGFPGEDYRSDRVPLAMVITKKGSSKSAIEKYLEPGNVCLPLEQLLHDEAYLASLDRTGLTRTRAQAAT